MTNGSRVPEHRGWRRGPGGGSERVRRDPHPRGVGVRRHPASRFRTSVDEGPEEIRADNGPDADARCRYGLARQIFDDVATREPFVESLAFPAWDRGRDHVPVRQGWPGSSPRPRTARPRPGPDRIRNHVRTFTLSVCASRIFGDLEGTSAARANPWGVGEQPCRTECRPRLN